MSQAKTNSFLTRIFILAALITIAVTPVQADLGATEVLADFEGGPPADWFTFFGGSTVMTSTQVVGDTDPLARTDQIGANEILSVDYNVVDFGGFGNDLSAAPQDWSNKTSFDFWFRGTASGLTYQAEISDNRSDPSLDTSERFDYEFTDNTAGWQYISIPFADFTRATDFQPGGAPDDGFTLTEIWAWAIILPGGADTVYFDDFGVGLFVIDDFESGLPDPDDGTGPNGEPLGFYTFSGDGPVSIATELTPPAPTLPWQFGKDNNVMRMDVDVASFGGYIHAFENAAVDTWVPQDWSTSEGISFWMYGSNSGTEMFIDILDNRNPGSTTDDAERFTVPFVDDFTGWQLLEFPFDMFFRKDIGNGAPNDGLGLLEMYGYAIGTLGTGGPRTFYFDNVSLYGAAEIPELAVTFAMGDYDIDEGATGDITVKLNRAMNSEDPLQVSVYYSTAPGTATPDRDYVPTGGMLTFINGGPSELTFPLVTIDDTTWEGSESILLSLDNPLGVEAGFITQAAAFIIDNEEFDPLLLDDFERFPYLWDASANVVLSNPEFAAGDPMALPGQGAYESVLYAQGPQNVDISWSGKSCKPPKSAKSDKSAKSGKSGKSGKSNKSNKSNKSDKSDKSDKSKKSKKSKKSNKSDKSIIKVVLYSTDDFDTATVDHTTVMLGNAYETHIDKKTGEPKRHEKDVNKDDRIDLVFHFRAGEAGVDCTGDVVPFNGLTWDGKPFTAGGSGAVLGENFAIGNDWSKGEALTFWFYGSGSGLPVTVELKDNRAPDPGPSGWELVWSEEFNEPAGALPNPQNWSYEIGDGTINGIPGWGNDELQYYTDDPANAATDGSGNLLITLDEADGSLDCYYGPCEYTSARLISQHKAEFAYGRIESRLQVPTGGDGLWPAFWSLGTDITYNPWPGAGEIDIMEYVSRIPNEIFGTVHGPGYNGGGAFGNIYDFGERVDLGYHTFTVEWQPNLIKWYVDGIQYHQAEPSDVPGPWVFEKPFFLLLNFAIGGNFGGAVDPANTYPQEYLVDYIRVFQGPDTAERFETSFVDNFVGWQQVVIPFADFGRSAGQPAGAPDDGLGLTEVWGYGFGLPQGGSFKLDQVQVQLPPPPTAITVVNLNDSGDGSLREALATIADGGTITLDPGLAGGTLALTSGQLVVDRDVTIDGSSTPGIVVSGGMSSRVFEIAAGAVVSMNDLEVADGAGAPQGGGILNFGTLNLDRVVVRDNMETSGGTSFDLGGGGIYNGDGATLNLTDSTVADNSTISQPGGGIYGFFNSTINVTRSTISGNIGGDVAGGLRTLGNATIVNSTISGNTSTAWHGGALFATDGTVTISNSTIVGNNAPGGTAGGLMVATFGGPVNVTIEDNIIADNGTYNCQIEGGPAAMLTSLGGNVNTDPSCSLIGSDQNVGPGGALVDGLGDNGGPTFTHALLPGSPAIDSAIGACPATDQRGVGRPQGGGCDVGAYETP